MTFDPDRFVERAAILEFDGGMTRFEAEVEAARAQGLQRFEAMEALKQWQQRQTSCGGTASASGGSLATSGQLAPRAASTERNQKTPVSASRSRLTASSGTAGTAV